MSDVSQQTIPLNDPPRLPPMPGMPPLPPDGFPSNGPPTQAAVQEAIARVTSTAAPEIEGTSTVVELPGGLMTPDGRLIDKAIVRELNGYDEEYLARLDMQKNVAVFVTELLMRGVVELDGEKPTKDLLLSLLVGDRDALVLGVRKATYGKTVEFQIHCAVCDTDSDVVVDLDEDVKVRKLKDPLTRVFDVELRKGRARVILLTGAAQERFSENISVKTRPEIDTLLLSRSVIELNGMPVNGNIEVVKSLIGADRVKLTDFIISRQCGPKFDEIPVPCATCGREYPISLGIPNLFRF
jgi:hypothetical protein